MSLPKPPPTPDPLKPPKKGMNSAEIADAEFAEQDDPLAAKSRGLDRLRIALRSPLSGSGLQIGNKS